MLSPNNVVCIKWNITCVPGSSTGGLPGSLSGVAIRCDSDAAKGVLSSIGILVNISVSNL
jgi:hypothetical protein